MIRPGKLFTLANAMFSESAELYDLIYAQFKDYAAEAAQIADLLRRVSPNCKSVLDVACGTGEHGRLLAPRGFAVDGLDLDPAFIRIARAKQSGGRFFVADMTSFHLPLRYDVVMCLFSSIAYARTLEGITAALRCFRAHLAPSGIVVVEPWFAPGVLDPTLVTNNEAESAGVRVSRRSRIEVDERLSRIHFDYEITDASGTRHVNEVHELGLFTSDEMLAAFRDAGLHADFDPHGLTGRGLYIARPAG